MKSWKIGLQLILILILISSVTNASELFNHWEPILEVTVPEMNLVERPDNVVGFLNESFGVMAGDWGESWFTNDGGKSWRKTESNFQTHRYGLEIINQNLIWSCGNTGNVFFSNNGTAEWQLVGSFGGSMIDSCKHLSFINSNTGWIASYSKLGMTNDGGIHWTVLPIPPKLNGIAAIALQTENTGYLFSIHNGGYLYITNDRGQTWISRRIGLKKQSYPVSAIDIRPTAAMRFCDAKHGLIIINAPGGLWELATSDGGKTWRQGPVPGKNGSLFLAPDGRTLTICDFENVITVLRRNPLIEL